MRRLLASSLALAVIAATPVQAQFRPGISVNVNVGCAPRAGCNPCGLVGNCYNPCGFYGNGGLCGPGYPVGYYPSFLYYGGFYGGSGLYSGGFYGGSFVPGTGAAPPTPSVFLTQNVANSNVCKFTVRCPETAQLWFDGNLIGDSGVTRQFRTPQLSGQNKFNYTVAAEWFENGLPVRMEQKIHFVPGDRLIVDFSNPNRPALASGPSGP